MSSGVHANPSDLRRFAKELRTARQEIDGMSKRLSRTLSSMDWKDQVKDRIESDVRQATSGLSKLSSRLEDHAKVVDKKAADLERYQG